MGGRGARSAIGKNAIMHGTTGTISRSAADTARIKLLCEQAEGSDHLT